MTAQQHKKTPLFYALTVQNTYTGDVFAGCTAHHPRSLAAPKPKGEHMRK